MMVAEMPYLRAFAVSLSGSTTVADDLVQETLVKAWSHADSFERGTNFRAWLVTILRNTYFNQYRKLSREVQDSDHIHAGQIAVGGEQESSVSMRDMQRAINQLPADQREILLMIGVTELSLRRPPKSAISRSAPLRAASIAPAPVWRNFLA